MKIDRVVAAPRIIRVGGRHVLVSPPSLRDLGLIFSFLSDVVPPPDGQPQGWTPSLGDVESIQALLSPGLGFGTLLYVAMHRDQPNIDFQETVELSGKVDPGDVDVLVQTVLVRNRPTDKMDISHWKRQDHSTCNRDQQINVINLGKMVESERVRNFSPDVVSRWTIDQLENKIVGGEPDFLTEGVPLSADDVSAWFEKMADPQEREKIRKQRETEEGGGSATHREGEVVG